MTRTNLQTNRRTRCSSLTLGILALAAACGDEGPHARPDKQPDRVLHTSDDESAVEVDDDREHQGYGVDAGTKPSAVLATREINQAFWFTGWKVTLGTATLKVEDGNRFGTLTLAATFENLLLGSSRQFGDSWLDDELVLAAGNQYYEVAYSGTDTPVLPSLRTGEGALVFSVSPTLDLDAATLLVGVPEYAQVKVPLGPKGEPLVSLEPTVLQLGTSLVSGDLSLNVERVVVKANEGDFQKEAGTRRLVVEFSGVYASSAKTTLNISSTNFALTHPDGSNTGAEIGGKYGLLYPGDKLNGYWFSFTVPEHFSGSYALGLTTSRAIPSSSLSFVLP